MRKTNVLKVYNLVNSNGDKLRLNLGIITEGLHEEYPIDSADKGFRWRFVGDNIPMPVRSGYWFNGFPEKTMIDWLKGNGWYPQSCVLMPVGKAIVFDLPDAPETEADGYFIAVDNVARTCIYKYIEVAKAERVELLKIYPDMDVRIYRVKECKT